MNRLLYLLLAIMMMLPLASCEEKDDIEYDLDVPATYQEVQGTWVKWWNAYKTTMVIKDNEYSVEVLNPFNEESVRSESGTFVMEGNVMTLTATDGESLYPKLEAWCQNKEHTQIFFSPFGVFNKQ